MAIRAEGSHLAFTSGRRVYANNLIVGIDEEGQISHGYDGGIAWPPYDDGEDGDGNDLTPEDMRELADMMIARWQKFKDALPK